MSEKNENNIDTPFSDISKDVGELVKELIAKYNYSSDSKVIYSIGSQVGDNYASKTIAVDVEDDKESRSLNLFLKYAHEVTIGAVPLDKIYENEIYFYDEIISTLTKFAEERGVKNAFTNIPKCFGTSTKHVIALGNLQKVGYQLFGRKKIMDENHIVLVLTAFARYHSLCFAFKDQEKEHFDKLTIQIHDLFKDPSQQDGPMKNVYKIMLEAFFGQLDLVKDKHILDKQEALCQRIQSYAVEQQNATYGDHNVITKGDCWSNNIMFRYSDENKEDPADVMLVDWQMLSINSVVIDLSYFFYTVACDGELDKLEYYQKIYHDELSKCIKDLGSDPDILYPFSVFEQEWKSFCIFGYMMGVLIINIMLLDTEDAPDFGKQEEIDIADQFAKIRTTPEYFRRLKQITEHFIKNEFI